MINISNENGRILVCLENIDEVCIDVAWSPDKCAKLSYIVNVDEKSYTHITITLGVSGPKDIIVREGFFRSFDKKCTVNITVPKIISIVEVDGNLHVTYNVFNEPVIYKDAINYNVSNRNNEYVIYGPFEVTKQRSNPESKWDIGEPVFPPQMDPQKAHITPRTRAGIPKHFVSVLSCNEARTVDSIL
jgi:hypothetical protein